MLFHLHCLVKNLIMDSTVNTYDLRLFIKDLWTNIIISEKPRIASELLSLRTSESYLFIPISNTIFCLFPTI
jgi:hypothetical protein